MAERLYDMEQEDMKPNVSKMEQMVEQRTQQETTQHDIPQMTSSYSNSMAIETPTRVDLERQDAISSLHIKHYLESSCTNTTIAPSSNRENTLVNPNVTSFSESSHVASGEQCDTSKNNTSIPLTIVSSSINTKKQVDPQHDTTPSLPLHIPTSTQREFHRKPMNLTVSPGSVDPLIVEASGDSTSCIRFDCFSDNESNSSTSDQQLMDPIDTSCSSQTTDRCLCCEPQYPRHTDSSSDRINFFLNSMLDMSTERSSDHHQSFSSTSTPNSRPVRMDSAAPVRTGEAKASVSSGHLHVRRTHSASSPLQNDITPGNHMNIVSLCVVFVCSVSVYYV